MKAESGIRRIYELFCFLTIIFYAFTLLILAVFDFEPINFAVLVQAEVIIAFILLLEFYLRIRVGESRLDYVKHNWLDLIAIFPINFIIVFVASDVSPLVFIIVKVVALIKIYALYKFSRKISDEVLVFAEKTRLFYGFAIYLFVIIFGSAAVFSIERSVNPNLQNLGDGFWYMIQTITTVGYGDVVPITNTGRIIGLVAMFTAIAFSSLLTATTTSAILEKFRKEREVVKKQGKVTLGNLFRKLDKLEEQMDEIKTRTDSINEIRSEIEELKEIIQKEEIKK